MDKVLQVLVNTTKMTVSLLLAMLYFIRINISQVWEGYKWDGMNLEQCNFRNEGEKLVGITEWEVVSLWRYCNVKRSLFFGFLI